MVFTKNVIDFDIKLSRGKTATENVKLLTQSIVHFAKVLMLFL